MALFSLLGTWYKCHWFWSLVVGRRRRFYVLFAQNFPSILCLHFHPSNGILNDEIHLRCGHWHTIWIYYIFTRASSLYNQNNIMSSTGWQKPSIYVPNGMRELCVNIFKYYIFEWEWNTHTVVFIGLRFDSATEFRATPHNTKTKPLLHTSHTIHHTPSCHWHFPFLLLFKSDGGLRSWTFL